ncbi:MAG: hypothetical protein NC037_01020 [Bacteroides sp.]|nr:hypothetical protein [Bacillota bacterium]MCM1393504.1 hypothetical protein [[Eubacterium] siraeum]MCM1455097.1 hypothetical protein [Bacteroides sp.]
MNNENVRNIKEMISTLYKVGSQIAITFTDDAYRDVHGRLVSALSKLDRAIEELDYAVHSEERADSDSKFIEYLGKLLLNSGVDCCSVCAYSSMTELCENSKQNEKLDDAICIAGLREFSERNEED